MATPVMAQADEVADFYSGRTVTIIVATDAGGTFAINTQVLANHLSEHIPGNPDVVVDFMPGAGGVRAANHMATAAAQDGTEISAVLSPSIMAPLLRDVRYDPNEFHWLGAITPMAGVVSVWHDAPATTIEELQTSEVIMAATSAVNETALIPVFINELLDTNFTVVTGYRGGGGMNLAVERGEAHGRVAAWDSWATGRPEWLSDNLLVHLFAYGPRHPELEGVPHLEDLVETEEQAALANAFAIGLTVGRAYYAPPGVPADRVEALRQAFADTLSDPDFLAEAEEFDIEVDPRSGAELQEQIERVFAAPDAVVEGMLVLVDQVQN
jgi:tripartite-type tricarboxylate transporter receptor subunit TctC